jgi:hypothetical protein
MEDLERTKIIIFTFLNQKLKSLRLEPTEKSHPLRILLFFLLFVLCPLFAKETRSISPIQIAFASPYQIVPKETTIIGFRGNILFGMNTTVIGLDTGLVNISRESAGVALGFANISTEAFGLQAGVVNYSENMYGLQPGFLNISGDARGLLIGGINFVGNSRLPLFSAFANVSNENDRGQISLGYNQAVDSPLQISVVANNTRKSVAQISGFFNFSNSSFLQLGVFLNSAFISKAQITLIFNSAGGYAHTQISGLANLAKSSEFQLSLLSNFSNGSNTQISGLFNRNEEGYLQLSGLINTQICLEKGPIKHQIALLANHSCETSSQIGLFNFTKKSGSQAGILNYGDSLTEHSFGIINLHTEQNGLILGLINDTDKLSGKQFGLFNIARNANFPITLFYNSSAGEEATEANTGLLNPEFALLQLGVYTPWQVYSRETNIYGLRLSILSVNNNSVYGLDLGVANLSVENRGLQLGGYNKIQKDFSGIQTGVINWMGESIRGLQLGAMNIQTHLTGVSLGLGVHTEQQTKGFQLGLLWNSGGYVLFPQLSAGVNKSSFTTMQISGLGNIVIADIWGPQFSGFYNSAKSHSSLQMAGIYNSSFTSYIQISGIFNSTRKTSLQLAGIGNYAQKDANIQIAGIFNIVSNDIRNLPFGVADDPFFQMALLSNLSSKSTIQISSLNIDRSEAKSQFGVVNFSERSYIQAGGINFSARLTGVQCCGINTYGHVTGLSAGLVNVGGKSTGVTIGLFNINLQTKGLTIGLFNYTGELKGIQIGILNFNTGARYPRSPVSILVNF